MDQENKTRDSQRSLTMDEQDQMNWSQSSQTYYYSKFQLFQDSQEINQFYRYSVFLQKLSKQLGQQWQAQAYVLFHPHFGSQDIFMNLLSVWLQFHPLVNTIHQNPITKQPSPVFNNNFIDQFVSRMKRLHSQNQMQDCFSTQNTLTNNKNKANSSNELKINSTSIKTVCMGFFITANQIWSQMFRVEQKNSHANKGFSLLKGVTKRIQERLQSFQPLMVVTQKICNLFGRKKVKIDQSFNKSAKSQDMFGDCYIQFRRTIGLQKQLQRKMSQFNLQDQSDLKSTQGNQKKKVIKDQFKDQQSPLQKSILSNVYSYVTKFLNHKYPWQVASSFVTNILDINQQNMDDGTKVKVLKPAQDFYEKLIIGWLMLTKCKQNKNSSQLSFQAYLSHIKVSFGKAWREKYIIPIKYFYQRLTKHWQDIHRQTTLIKLSQKQILNSLIYKIRESMRQDWQRKIKIQKKQKKQLK